MATKNSPIGVFDSGVGGISVLKALQKELPQEDFIFLGDNLHAPYGEKSIPQIQALSEANLSFLLSHDAKAIVIACNTATSAAAALLRERYPALPIIGMEPAVKPAAVFSSQDFPAEKPSVLVLATPSTIEGERLHHLVARYADLANYHLLAAPNIVRLVEAGQEDSAEMHRYLRELLAPYRSEGAAPPAIPVQHVVLGCTHFPFAQSAIRQALGYPVQFFDGAQGTAKETHRRLQEQALLSTRETPGHTAFYSSAGAQYTDLMQRLLETPLSETTDS